MRLKFRLGISRDLGADKTATLRERIEPLADPTVSGGRYPKRYPLAYSPNSTLDNMLYSLVQLAGLEPATSCSTNSIICL